jgi:uncharacterized LabA/DUF88 family protein
MADRVMVFVDHSNLAGVVRRSLRQTVSIAHYRSLIKTLSRGYTQAACKTSAKRPSWAFVYVPDNGIIDVYRTQLIADLKILPGVFQRGGLITWDSPDMCRSQVRQTKTGWRACGSECKGITEKMIDVALATDMVRFACRNEYDTAFLVSQDRDFIPAVQAVRAEGKIVIHAFVRTSAITGVCNGFRDIKSIFTP